MNASRPPGPTSRSPLGIAPQFARDPLGFVTGLARNYGDFVTIPGPGYRPSFLLSNPDLAHQVLVKQADQFQKPPALKRVFLSTFGNGLFFSEGDFWRRQRRLAQPAFHHKRIQAYSEEMVGFAQEMLATWQSGQQHHVDAVMRALTLQIVVNIIFHSDVSGETAQIGRAMEKAGAAISEQASNPLKAILPDWLPLPLMRRKRQSVAALDAIIYRLIEERRQAGQDAGDLISMFLLAVDEETGERMSDRQVHDEVMTLFIAGHETTALTLTWAWVMLAQHPAAAACLHAELDQALGGRPPAVADLPHLPYTEAIVKEVLRLYPPAWLIFRQALADLEIGGYLVKKGEIIWITPYLVHRDGRYYEEADQFRPERFLADETGQSLEKRLPRMAYLPFGGGPRICLGNGFAMLEAQLMLATIAQRYSLELPPGETVEMKPAATLGFRNQVVMTIVGW